MTREAGQAWAEPGAAGHDARDGNLTASVTITGTVDMNTTGTYVLTYSVADAAGNTATANRTVTVVGNRSVDLNATVAMDMLWVPAGTFTMGSPTTEAGEAIRSEDEHNVSLTKGFYLGKYEVTQAQYEAVTGYKAECKYNATGNGEPTGRESKLAEAVAFCTQLNHARAGSRPIASRLGLCFANRIAMGICLPCGHDLRHTHGGRPLPARMRIIIGTAVLMTETILNKPAMWGNMRPTPGAFLICMEMCGSGPQTGTRRPIPAATRWLIPRVRHRARSGLRGGSWSNGGTDLRSAKRAAHPQHPLQHIGFRVGFQPVQPDTANPELELFGGASVTREAGQAWAEPGAAGHDARDGNLTASVTITGTVDMNTTGTYVLTYSVADAAGNTATANRTVTVVGNRSVDLNASVAMDMLWVPAGTFTMGSPTTEAGREASKEQEHNVSLTKGFYLGKYEVTQAQYEAVMTGNTNSLSAKPSEWPNNPNRPVEKVSWEDVQVFITRLNAQQSANIPAGWAYVLPTESQWEYASRAGTTTAYSWGATIASSNANYNWDGGANDGNDFKQTRDVGQYAANPWGFFDMHGNVWEWTADWYQAAYPSGNPVVDPTGPASGSNRVLRGGSWTTEGTALRSASARTPPPAPAAHIGFRVGFQKQ